MTRTLVVTDSSACIPDGLAAGLGIGVVPLRIHLGSGATLSDMEEGARTAVYRAMEAGEEVKSSAPPPTEYLEAVEAGEATSAVIITPAVEFTAMYRSAAVACRLSARPCTVVDCRAVAAGQALIVAAAAEAAQGGARHDEVVRVAEDASRRSDMLAVVEGLSYLGRSGRVPSATVEKAGRRGTRSVFRVREGLVELVAATTSDDEAVDRLLRHWRQSGGPRASASAVFHATVPDRAARLAGEVGTDLVTEFSPAMGVHTGPGVVGVSWLRAAGAKP
ncbi:MAG TPA: DegV family protein [Acidimicrobiales bacterium]|nr:DegV family protein [Acidimicrobiales bacterium]